MTPEEETLQKIKQVLEVGNESQAIRFIEQYGQFKQDQIKRLTLTDVSCSFGKEKVKQAFNDGKNGLGFFNIENYS